MSRDDELTGTFLITAALVALAFLGGVYVDRILFAFMLVFAIMLAVVGREIQCR